MSKRKDRARAESGLIFRNGHLVNKEDWYKANPTRAQRQAGVDKAVAEVMAKKVAHIPEVEPPKRYYCTACCKYHIRTSKVGKEHILEEA